MTITSTTQNVEDSGDRFVTLLYQRKSLSNKYIIIHFIVIIIQ